MKFRISALQKAASKKDDGVPHRTSQAFEGLNRRLLSLLGPLLQQAGFRMTRWRLHPGLMADKPEQGKLVKGTTGEDGFKIKLDVRLLAQGSVVTQYAQLLTIGNEPPEVVVRTVEKVLHH